VIAIEEMPKNSRAFATGVLAMFSGFGAGTAVMALPLADKTEFLAPGTVTWPAKGPLCEATMMSPTVFDPSDMAISMLPPYP
jgi:hypothetical protein